MHIFINGVSECVNVQTIKSILLMFSSTLLSKLHNVGVCFFPQSEGREGLILEEVENYCYLDSLVSPATVCLLRFNS